jgi:hypothetical protein
VGDGTGYSPMLTLPSAGRYVLVAVVMRDDVVLGRSLRHPVAAVAQARAAALPLKAHQH